MAGRRHSWSRSLCAAALVLLALSLPAGARTGSVPIQVVTGWDSGWPELRGWTVDGAAATMGPPGADWMLRLAPYPTWRDGVRVAVGDLDGDGRNEIITAPGGGFGDVHVFDGRSLRQLASFAPHQSNSWWGGVFVATGDTDGDHAAEVAAGLDAGCCTAVSVLDGLNGKPNLGFMPFGPTSEAGARVAAADLNGDGKAELLAMANGSHTVSAYTPDGGNPFRSVDVFGGDAYGPVSFTAGDLLGDSRPELVAASATGGGPTIKVIDLLTGTAAESLVPFGPAASAPQVALADIDGDGRNELVTSAQSSAGTQVRVLAADGRQLNSFFVLEPGIVPGASLAAGDLDGDGKAEILLGGGPTPTPPPPVNGPDQRVAVYDPDGTIVGSFSAYPGVFQGGVRVALGDLTGDRQPEMVTAPGPGMAPQIGVFTSGYDRRLEHNQTIARFLAYEPGFRGGVTVALGDVLGRGSPQIITGPGPGRPATIRVFDTYGSLLSSFAAFEDSYQGGVSVAAGDLDADGRAEIVVASQGPNPRLRGFRGDGTPFGTTIIGGSDRGYQLAVADLNGTGRGLVIAAEATGPDPQLLLADIAGGSVRRVANLFPWFTSGLRVGAGDLNSDGRDELVVASAANGGDGLVRVLDQRLLTWRAFSPYGSSIGLNVAAPIRLGLPIRADAVTAKLVLGKRTRLILAHFTDLAPTRTPPLAATIGWGDGTNWNGLLIRRTTPAGTVFDVRSTKRYTRVGRYPVTVTFTDGAGRTSIAHSTITVRKR